MIAYLIGFIYLGTKLLKETGFNQSLLKKIALLAIILHGSAAVNLLIAFVINVIVFVSGQNKPLHSMYLALFPISAISLALALITPSTKPVITLSSYIQVHVLASILAYSLLAFAALQALLTGYQNWQLKHKRQNLLMRTFPPLQTMEEFLFELIWAGEALLTLSLISGFLFYEDLFDQKLLHKVGVATVVDGEGLRL